MTGTVVVFVHGLKGNPRRTWGKMLEYVCALGTVDVLAVGYPTAAVLRAPPVDAIGGFLISQLGLQCDRYENIMLVGHSLGCLVIEAAIVRELQLGNGRDRPMNQVKHAVLYAPPHLGSNFARLLGRIPALLNAQSRFLGSDHRHLIRLQEDWFDRVHSAVAPPGADPNQSGVGLTIVAGLRDNWVPVDVARAGYSDQVCEILNETHASIKSPASPSADSFVLLRRVIESVCGLGDK